MKITNMISDFFRDKNNKTDPRNWNKEINETSFGCGRCGSYKIAVSCPGGAGLVSTKKDPNAHEFSYSCPECGYKGTKWMIFSGCSFLTKRW